MRTLLRATLASVLLALGACADRNDRLAEIDSDFANKCVSYNQETKFLGTGANYSDELDRVFSYLERTELGEQISRGLVESDTVICMDFQTEDQMIDYSQENNAYLISPKGSVEKYVRFIFEREASPRIDQALPLTETLKAYDFLQLSRAITTQKALILVASAYEMAGNSFDSEYWQNFEARTPYKNMASSYRNLVENGLSFQKAREAVFIEFYSDNRNHNDRPALEWYRAYLHPRNVTSVSMCMGFDGGLDPCLSPETVYPDETVASQRLDFDNITELTKVGFHTSFLADETIGVLLNRPLAPTDPDLFAIVEADVEKCCGENRRTGRRNSALGFGSRGIGISLF